MQIVTICIAIINYLLYIKIPYRMESSQILETIDHKMLVELSNSSLLEEVGLIGNKQGWRIVIKYKNVEKYLSATRSKEVRIFRKVDSAVFYLGSLGVDKVVVHTIHSDLNIPKRSRPDTSEALKKTHAIAKKLARKK